MYEFVCVCGTHLYILKNTKLLILYPITLLETVHILFVQPVEIRAE